MSGHNVSLWRVAAALLGTFCSACVANVYDVCDFGALGDGLDAPHSNGAAALSRVGNLGD